jgi:hypothetical protein
VLDRRPSNGLDCGGVLCELELRFRSLEIPYEKLVVIAPRSKLLPIKTPFQPTDLFVMARERLNDTGVSQIMMIDESVLTPTRDLISVPGKSRDSILVPLIRLEDLHPFSIPNLYHPVSLSNCQSHSILVPAERSGSFPARLMVIRDKELDVVGLNVLDVDVTLQSNGEFVGAAPVQKVQVEVVLNPRRV